MTAPQTVRVSMKAFISSNSDYSLLSESSALSA